MFDFAPFLDETAWDRLLQVPGAASRLRRVILQLAVRGRLVPQDGADEPAQVLVERIARERARRVKAGEMRKSKPLPPVGEDEKFVDVPKNWTWVRLTNLGEFCGGMTPSMGVSRFWNGNIPWVSPKDMKASRISGAEMSVTDAALKETSIRLIPPLSLLVVGRSGILKRALPVALNDVECVVNQDLKVIIPFNTEMPLYLQLMLQGFAPFILSELIKTGTTVQSLKYDEFELQPFPLPPLAEQKRIVAKVDELMVLCDVLESEVRAAQESGTTLWDALEARLRAD